MVVFDSCFSQCLVCQGLVEVPVHVLGVSGAVVVLMKRQAPGVVMVAVVLVDVVLVAVVL